MIKTTRRLLIHATGTVKTSAEMFHDYGVQPWAVTTLCGDYLAIVMYARPNVCAVTLSRRGVNLDRHKCNEK